MESLLSEPGVYIHIYGKEKVKGFRKMGHFTITADSVNELKVKALRYKKWIMSKGI
jgi:5-(carboxyamino)imidazole ribonucleotide synthase